MSLVTYNGVTLPYSYATSFNQEAVYDDQSQTDRYVTKFDITIQCLVNASYINYIVPQLQLDTPPSGAAEVMNIVRNKLLQARQAFSFVQNGVQLLPLLKGPGTVDAKNGPTPMACTLTEMDNTTYLMTYHIIAHYWETDNFSLRQADPPTLASGSLPPQVGNAILYNRWSETAEIDNCMYTTRTRTGQFRIRSDNSLGLIADQVRTSMAVVGVPKGFLRQNSHYTVDPSGLAVAYTVVDREVFKKPPNPAFEAEGEYMETGTRNNAQRFGEVRIKLKGSKTTAQSDLVKAAIAVANCKLRNRGAVVKGLTGVPAVTRTLGIPESTALRISMYSNEVEFTMRVRYTVDKKRIGGLSAFVNFPDQTFLTFTPGSDGQPEFFPNYTSRGTAAFLLQAAAYYDPSVNAALVELRGQNSKGDSPPTSVGVYNSQMSPGVVPGQGGAFPEV